MKKHNITLIPGDGIGPEITSAAVQCIEATGVDIQWDIQNAGLDVFKKTNDLLPQCVVYSIKKNRVALKGPLTTPVGSGIRSVNVALRMELDLYACIRPCKLLEGARSRYKDIDIVVVRENTEDLYAGIEFNYGTGEALKIAELISSLGIKKNISNSAISIKPISELATRRIVRFAFEYAVKNNRKKVTVVHKANIMKATDGLFLWVAREVAQQYQEKVEFEDRIVDNMCMQLVQKPELYDVLVLPNLYGDIISDLCAGLIGGLGMAPGANFGDNIVVFEAVHGSAPRYKGMNKVNPTAMLLSSVLMLQHIQEKKAAERLYKAVADVIKEGRYVTYDLKGKTDIASAVGTSEMADAIIEKMRR